MATYLLRVWLPDRPGALGAVAARIGSVGVDVVGIEILERDGGVAVDQLVVELPDKGRLVAMVDAVHGLDGVAVEEATPLPEGGYDPVGAALTASDRMCTAATAAEVFAVLVDFATTRLGADWAAVVGGGGTELLATAGSPPPLPWLDAFCQGTRFAGSPAGAGSDIVVAPLASTTVDLVAGRPGRRYLAAERLQAEKLTSIGGARVADLTFRRAREHHPSAAMVGRTAVMAPLTAPVAG